MATKPAARPPGGPTNGKHGSVPRLTLDGLDLSGMAPDAGALFGADMRSPWRDYLGRRALAVADVLAVHAEGRLQARREPGVRLSRARSPAHVNDERRHRSHRQDDDEQKEQREASAEAHGVSPA